MTQEAATAPINVARRVTYRGGRFGMLSGESQGKAFGRVPPELNAAGYRVAFVVSDKRSLGKPIWAAIV